VGWSGVGYSKARREPQSRHNKRGGKTMNPKEKEMRQEAKERIIECLKNGYTGYYCDLHNEVFNTDYYIIGIYEAKKH